MQINQSLLYDLNSKDREVYIKTIDHLFKESQNMLIAYLIGEKGATLDVAEDCLSKCFLSMLTRKTDKPFKLDHNENSLVCYLKRAVANALKSYREQRQKIRERIQLKPCLFELQHTTNITPLSLLEQQDLQEEITYRIQAILPPMQYVCMQYDLAGYSRIETAKCLQKKAGNVRKAICKAKENLKSNHARFIDLM